MTSKGGSPVGFSRDRDPGLGLFEGQDLRIKIKERARCGIFVMNGTRESVILRGGTREIITLTNREPGSPLTRIQKSLEV